MIILIVGWKLVSQMGDINKVSNQNSDTVTAIVDDWNKTPFTAIRVTDNKCTSSE